MGHQGSVEKKLQAIEYLDARVVGPLTEALDRSGEAYRLLVMPDHPTPIRIRTHTAESVPYLLYDSTSPQKNDWNYNEAEAILSGNFIPEGISLWINSWKSNRRCICKKPLPAPGRRSGSKA